MTSLERNQRRQRVRPTSSFAQLVETDSGFPIINNPFLPTKWTALHTK